MPDGNDAYREKMITLDALDRQILHELQEDCRIQYRELAKRTGKAIGTISNRIQNLIRKGVIKRWTIQIDPEALGYDFTAILHIKIDVVHINQINKELAKIKELYALYNVTGDDDIVALGRFVNRRHLDQVIHRILAIPHIQRTSTSLVLRQLKEDLRVHVPQHEESQTGWTQ